MSKCLQVLLPDPLPSARAMRVTPRRAAGHKYHLHIADDSHSPEHLALAGRAGEGKMNAVDRFAKV
ncbi:hypothetical protein SBA6_590083 [Candidatus Sulfopaludibacter sp. SbA6]|nr:hypothetical protein SBA6_590083 [Candidatus Sulfopaludibacter sp. SbA6]